MQFVVAFAKKLPWTPIVAFLVGLILGLLWAWVISPVQVVDVTPASLRADLREDYLQMTLDSFRVNGDPNLAVQRWKNLGPNAQTAFQKVQAKSNDAASQAAIDAFDQIINQYAKPDAAAPKSSSLATTLILGAGILVLLVLGIAAFIYLRRLLGKRSSGTPTAVMQAVELSKQAEKTDFQSLGLAPPITQIMTTYVMGDDLYDESFSIDAPGGEFMGEYGVAISETIGVGDPKRVAALEVWPFDKNDIKTATKVLMGAHVYSDQNVRAKLEPKGELVLVEPQKQVMLETQTLQLLVTITDLEYGPPPLPDKSYFQRITLELAIWPKGA